MNDPVLERYDTQFTLARAHWQQLRAPAMPLPQRVDKSLFRRFGWVALPLLLWGLWNLLPTGRQGLMRDQSPVVIRTQEIRVQVRLPGSLPTRPASNLPALSPPRPQRKPVPDAQHKKPARMG